MKLAEFIKEVLDASKHVDKITFEVYVTPDLDIMDAINVGSTQFATNKVTFTIEKK